MDYLMDILECLSFSDFNTFLLIYLIIKKSKGGLTIEEILDAISQAKGEKDNEK